MIKNFEEFLKERFGTFRPIPFESPKINQYSQGTPNGMAGTYEPDNKTIDPDDQMKFGYPRFARNLNPSNEIIHGTCKKRRWRKRREQKKKLRKN